MSISTSQHIEPSHVKISMKIAQKVRFMMGSFSRASLEDVLKFNVMFSFVFSGMAEILGKPLSLNWYLMIPFFTIIYWLELALRIGHKEIKEKKEEI